MILDVVLFCIFSYTLSSIIVQQKIFQEVREWIDNCSTEPSFGITAWARKKMCQLIRCMFCTGFWSGLFISLVLGYMPVVGAGYILHGFLGSFSSYSVNLVMSILIKKAEELGIDT